MDDNRYEAHSAFNIEMEMLEWMQKFALRLLRYIWSLSETGALRAPFDTDY